MDLSLPQRSETVVSCDFHQGIERWDGWGHKRNPWWELGSWLGNWGPIWAKAGMFALSKCFLYCSVSILDCPADKEIELLNCVSKLRGGHQVLFEWKASSKNVYSFSTNLNIMRWNVLQEMEWANHVFLQYTKFRIYSYHHLLLW